MMSLFRVASVYNTGINCESRQTWTTLSNILIVRWLIWALRTNVAVHWQGEIICFITTLDFKRFFKQTFYLKISIENVSSSTLNPGSCTQWPPLIILSEETSCRTKLLRWCWHKNRNCNMVSRIADKILQIWDTKDSTHSKILVIDCNYVKKIRYITIIFL